MPIRLYLDDSTEPFREISNAEKFVFDTTEVPDGPHRLRVETLEDGRVTGHRDLSFTIRNGPGIAIAGIAPGDELSGAIPLLVNASEAGIDSRFDAHSMETHRGIPFWVGGFAAVVILACAAYLATDPLRHREYGKQAEAAAALLGRALPTRPPIPIDAQPPEGSAADRIERPPHPQNMKLAAGEFLDIYAIADLPVDPLLGSGLFAARCSGCHGAEAQGTVQEKVTLAEEGVYPRLAGQDRTYIYRQLISFEQGWRDSAQMVPMAKSLSEQDKLNIAAYIEALSPTYPPRHNVPDAVMQRGKLIAEGGIPHAGVARCSGCHGADGAGGGTNFPYLAGQWPQYLEAQLRGWQNGTRRNAWRGVMRPVASGLSDDDLVAVAAYFASIRPNRD